MDRPVSLLHVVGGKEVHNARKLEQQVVFEAKHGRWPHDGGLWEDAPGNLLGATLEIVLDTSSRPDSKILYLGRVELGDVVRVGVVGRDVDESVYIVLGNGVGNALRTLHMDILEREVPGPVSSPFSFVCRRARLTW